MIMQKGEKGRSVCAKIRLPTSRVLGKTEKKTGLKGSKTQSPLLFWEKEGGGGGEIAWALPARRNEERGGGGGGRTLIFTFAIFFSLPSFSQKDIIS